MGAASSSVNEMQAMIILYMNFLQKYEKILCLDNIVTIFEFAFPTMRYSVEDSRIHYGSDNEDAMKLAYHVLNRISDRNALKKIFARDLYAIHLNVISKDQGWSSYPQHDGKRCSHTWGEVACNVSRSGASGVNAPTRYRVFRNIQAGKEYEKHTMTFGKGCALKNVCDSAIDQYRSMNDKARIAFQEYNQEYDVRKVEDKAIEEDQIDAIDISLYARSMYPGWNCYIKFSQIELEFKITNSFLLHIASQYRTIRSHEKEE
jgi:hypothetical protein